MGKTIAFKRVLGHVGQGREAEFFPQNDSSFQESVQRNFASAAGLLPRRMRGRETVAEGGVVGRRKKGGAALRLIIRAEDVRLRKSFAPPARPMRDKRLRERHNRRSLLEFADE